jgi:hypothetical protein
VKKAVLFISALALPIALSTSAVVASGCSGGGTGGGSGGGSATGGGSAAGGGAGGGFMFDVTCDANPNAETAQTVFTNVVSANCVTACHTPGGQAIAYSDYTTANLFFTDTVGVASIYAGSNASLKMVAPNDLANSTVWLKVSCPQGSTSCKSPHGETIGSSMPYQTVSLSAANQKVIKDWICTGAKQN